MVIYNPFLHGSRGWLRCCLTKSSFCLNNDEGATALTNYFSSAFLKDESSKGYERHNESDSYYKDSSIKMEEDYVEEFEVAFKILDSTKLRQWKCQLILTGADCTKREPCLINWKKHYVNFMETKQYQYHLIIITRLL